MFFLIKAILLIFFKQDMLWSGLRHFKLDVEKVIEVYRSKCMANFFFHSVDVQ